MTSPNSVPASPASNGRRIVFFDVDGTLIDHGGPVQDSTRQAIRKARQRGHLAYICTGRSAADIPEDVREIGFDGEITNGGVFAHVGDHEVRAATMPRADVAFLTQLFRDAGYGVLIQTHEQTYADAEGQKQMAAYDQYLGEQMGGQSGCGPSSEATGIGISLQGFDEPEDIDLDTAAKVLFVTPEDVDYSQLRAALGPNYYLVLGSMPLHQGASGEVTLAGTTKAAAIEDVLAHYGMTPDQAVGIGDSWNDVEMFDLVADAVAMDNAPQGVKARANHATTSVAEDGTARALEFLGLT